MSGTMVGVVVAVFLGAIVSGYSGFAFSAVAGAILYHFIDPLQAVCLMLACTITIQIATLIALRKHIEWHESGPLLAGGIIGVPLGVYLLTVIDKHNFRLGFGLFLSLYAVFMLLRSPNFRFNFARTRALVNFTVGSAGGVLGGLTAMPGAIPVIWCDLCGMTKERQRGITQPYIVIMQIVALSLLAMNRRFDILVFVNIIFLVFPALIIGTLLGFMLFGKIDEFIFRKIVFVLLLLSGCAMIV